MCKTKDLRVVKWEQIAKEPYPVNNPIPQQLAAQQVVITKRSAGMRAKEIWIGAIWSKHQIINERTVIHAIDKHLWVGSQWVAK